MRFPAMIIFAASSSVVLTAVLLAVWREERPMTWLDAAYFMLAPASYEFLSTVFVGRRSRYPLIALWASSAMSIVAGLYFARSGSDQPGMVIAQTFVFDSCLVFALGMVVPCLGTLVEQCVRGWKQTR